MMKSNLLKGLFIGAILCSTTDAFLPAKIATLRNHAQIVVDDGIKEENEYCSPTGGGLKLSPRLSMTSLWSENSGKKKRSGGLDEGLRNKLVTESIAPWRTIRLFLYGALGSGAFVGGLINISGAIAASNSPDFNLQTEVSSKLNFD
jgi:hypothetical protein